MTVEGCRGMPRRNLKSEFLLLVTAAIWGFAFVAQRAGMEHVGPFTFNGIRFALGSLALALILILRRARTKRLAADRVPSGCREYTAPPGFGGQWTAKGHREVLQFSQRRVILGASVIAGVVLFGGASFQQVGIVYTTAGKAGFITGLYVIIVPILGLLWALRPGHKTWLGAMLAVGGLYLLSVHGTLSISLGDLLVLISAFFWAGHVLVIGWLSPRMDYLGLACLQFAVCSFLSFACSFATEAFNGQAVSSALIPILYAGLLSTGVAYTLQVAAQRRVPAAHAAIIMSMEAVFAALGGWLLLRETVALHGILGCCLMLAGMVISQLDSGGSRRLPQINADQDKDWPQINADKHRSRQNWPQINADKHGSR
jgi:drug/metabolite transporter (DMT)-like permease